MKTRYISLLSTFTFSLLIHPSLASTPAGFTLPDDAQFSNQEFSHALFEQIPAATESCEAYNLEVACYFKRQHLFNDAILINEQNGTKSITLTLQLHEPVARDRALTYFNMLDSLHWLDHAVPEVQSEKVVYRGCVAYYGGPSDFENYGYNCQATLNLVPNGHVNSIEVIHWSP